MMQLYIQKVASLLLLLFMLLLVCLQPAAIGVPQTAALRVLAIEIDGKTADRAEGVVLTVSGESAPRKTALKTGDALAQGTEIVVPPHTVLVLETTNGNQIRLQPGCGYRTGSVSGRGETHTMLFGKAFFRVKHALDFFNVNYESFLAIVRGTEFSVEVEPKKEISFSLDKGRLLVQRDVKVRILEGDKVADMKASEVLQQGGKTTVSYRLGIDEYLQEFKTFRDAETYYRKIFSDAQKNGEYEELQSSRCNLGAILITLGKSLDSIQYYETALQQAKIYNDNIREGWILNDLGVAYHNLNQYSEAIDYYNKSLAIQLVHHKNEIDEFIAGTYINLGNAYLHKKKHSYALYFYNKALDIRTHLFADKENIIFASNHLCIGAACDELKLYQKSIEHYNKASEIILRLYPQGAHPVMASIYYNLGITNYTLNKFTQAIDNFNKSINITLRLFPQSTRPDIASCHNNIGVAYLSLGEHYKGIDSIKKALAIRLKLYPNSIHPDIASSYINLSIAYEKSGDQARANEYAKKARDIENKLEGK